MAKIQKHPTTLARNRKDVKLDAVDLCELLPVSLYSQNPWPMTEYWIQEMIKATESADLDPNSVVTNAHPPAITRASATPAGVRSGQKLPNALSKYVVASSAFAVCEII